MNSEEVEVSVMRQGIDSVQSGNRSSQLARQTSRNSWAPRDKNELPNVSARSSRRLILARGRTEADENLLATVLINDALRGRREALTLMTAESLNAYRHYHRASFRRIVFGASWIVVILTFFEAPNLKVPERAVLPLSVTIPIEIACVIVFFLDCWLQFKFLGRDWTEWRKDSWAKWKAVAFILMVVDIAITVTPAVNNRFSRPFRPIFGLARMRHVRMAVQGIMRSIPAIAVILVLILFFVTVSAMIFWLIFDSNLQPWSKIVSFSNSSTGICSSFDDGCNQYFGTFADSMYQSVVLLTGVNFPDVMVPYYDVAPWSAYFFLAHIVFGFYFLNRLLVAASFDQYQRDTEKQMLKVGEGRARSIAQAFEILSDSTGRVPVDRWIEVVRSSRPSTFSEEEAKIMFDCVDDLHEKVVPRDRFEELIQYLDIRLVRQNKMYTPLQLKVRAVVKSSWFTLLFDAIVIVSVGRLTVLRVISHTKDTAGKQGIKEAVDPIAYALASMFVVEVLLKLYALGWYAYWSDFFNRLDFIVVIPSLVGTITLDIIYQTTQGDIRSEAILSAMFIIRLLRIFRVFRLVRFLRHKTTWNVLSSFSKTLPIFQRFLVILLSILFCFAIIGMESFSTCLVMSDPKVAASSYAFQNLESFNFKDFGTSFATTFVLLMARKLPAIFEGTLAGCGWGSALYFILFYIVVVQVFTSVFVAFVIEAYGNIKRKDEQPKHIRYLSGITRQEEAADKRIMDSIAHVTGEQSRESLNAQWKIERRNRFVDLVDMAHRRGGPRKTVFQNTAREIARLEVENSALLEALAAADPSHPLLVEHRDEGRT